MSIVNRIRSRLSKAPDSSPADLAERHLKSILNRRNARSELGALSPEYFSRQTTLVRDRLIAAIRANPSERLESLLADPDYALLGERVVEYGWIARRLFAEKTEGVRPRLLDVGCVLNNAIITDVVMESCDSIWLMNPASEPLEYAERVAYLLADPRRHFLPADVKFPRVTCFSTLEHVGMNNVRYGGDVGVSSSATTHPEDEALGCVKSLWDLTAARGWLSLSVPFGTFEYLYAVGDPAPIYYTFDKERFLNLLRAADAPLSQWNVEVWKVVPARGWVPSTLEDREILPHATDCVGAGAVAIASIRKPS